MAYSIIREVLELSTSGYIHLGADERNASLACFEEAGMEKPTFSEFEEKLSHLLKFDNISSTSIIRWENSEKVDYGNGRLGDITQCRSGDCRLDLAAGSDWFATVDIFERGPWQIYDTTRQLALRNPTGILAEVGTLGSSFSEQFSKRLLAFAMGISTLEDWSRGAFEETFIVLCEETFGNQSGCVQFASNDTGVPVDQQNILDRCSERTDLIRERFFRPEYQDENETASQGTIEVDSKELNQQREPEETNKRISKPRRKTRNHQKKIKKPRIVQ